MPALPEKIRTRHYEMAVQQQQQQQQVNGAGGGLERRAGSAVEVNLGAVAAPPGVITDAALQQAIAAVGAPAFMRAMPGPQIAPPPPPPAVAAPSPITGADVDPANVLAQLATTAAPAGQLQRYSAWENLRPTAAMSFEVGTEVEVRWLDADCGM